MRIAGVCCGCVGMEEVMSGDTRRALRVNRSVAWLHAYDTPNIAHVIGDPQLITDGHARSMRKNTRMYNHRLSI